MKKIPCIIAILAMHAGSVQAAQLTYQPTNPSFGGSPLNGSFLMQEAVDNNHFQGNSYKAPTTPPLTQTQQLAQQITNEVLGSVASQIAATIYGPNAQNSGSYQLGDTTISFNRVNGNINLNIINGSGTTSLTIPAP